ncbi:putative O-glycosylation ligase, exosortase A system-associated [Pelomonas cellulosilytica]|uniref:O-glycosylation ligase, exosortase A system-associated n=1 Tax=Pelomonas cellulosilytica TaxID=2906762 RepID=A0ABS8Y2Z5_9BURK|nr:putative O-glycosylation ligase, exosortase A system-associated [Pelomonas sp. P8]MCE4557562.1 putative O-glycosylation ligase, exosortase A system-associated [Pelomonas sp. P8]
MRDLVLLALLAYGTLYALREPWIGTMIWTNVSLMSPHAQFGNAAGEWPVATGVALTTMIGLVMHRDKAENPLRGAPAMAILAFTFWITFTLPFSIYFDDSFPLWVRSMKIFLMLFVTIALLTDKRKINVFVAVMTFSIAFYGIKGGMFTLATAGSYRVWGPGGFIGGNNELALALIMTIPMMRYLQLQVTNKWLSRGLTFGMAMTAVTVLGTYSRGALLGLSAMAIFLWIKSPKKLGMGLVLVLGGALALGFMPEQWWDRMHTIKTYNADESALGRINAWWNAFHVANDRPFGGGFMIYMPEVFARYAPDPNDVHAAHSIYFQVLGEHGWIGLLVFVSIGALTWRDAGRLSRLTRNRPELRWAGELGVMTQVAMVGYAVAGAFLSLAYYDFPYNQAAAIVAAYAIVRKQLAAARKPVPTL